MSSPKQPDVSLIVPTYNRRARLEATLSAVSRQTFPKDRMEVLVIDDGSRDDTPELAGALGEGIVYVRRPHAGATATRNTGAAYAKGELLVFVDDDVELMPDAVGMLASAHRKWRRAVVVGHLLSPAPENRYQRLRVIPERMVSNGYSEIECVECFTGLLSVNRQAFFALGRFQDPTGGWPSWDDIDFGYRAFAAGFSLVRCSYARGIHHDHSATSLDKTARRLHAASEAAVRLLLRYPDLRHSMPFYRDKLPINWGRDPSSLVVRKVLRSLASSYPTLEVIEAAANLSLRQLWPSQLARPLCGCVISGNMWRGIREGIKADGTARYDGLNDMTPASLVEPLKRACNVDP